MPRARPSSDDDDNQFSGDDIARRQLGWYLANAARSPLATRYQETLIHHVRRLADGPEDDLDSNDLAEIAPKARNLYHVNRARRRAAARQILADFATYPSGEDPVDKNLAYATEEFGFDAIEGRILRLIIGYQQSGVLEAFADDLMGRLRQPAQVLATLTGDNVPAVVERLSPKGRLRSGGFLVVDLGAGRDFAGLCRAIDMSPPLRRAMRESFDSRAEWLAAVCGEPSQASLGWDDFAHLGAARDLALRVLAGAMERQARGVNMLLYGAAGTGKTEFCKTLAAQLGAPIWQVGEADDEGREPMRGERLASLHLAQALLSKRGRALVMLDEAEDVITAQLHAPTWPLGSGERTGSKVYTNRLLEQNQLPVLWTCNRLGGIDPAVLRRFTQAIEIRIPSAPVRTRIWRRSVVDTGAKIDEAAIERFAKSYAAPPALIANAARAVRLADGGGAEAELLLTSSMRVIGRAAPIASGDASGFDPALTCCAQDLQHLAASLSRPGVSRNWSICISGPPGTGKSYFASHLADRLGLEVTRKRASDLLSMWVGESEKAIAEAFAQARAEGAVLIFDEADSLLADRAGAQHSWEVSQVNEMLTWMESHPLPFICTTNLIDRLDKASLRRFTFKLAFETLRPEQNALAFSKFFELPPPRDLPEGLATGDFAVVRRKRSILGTDDPIVLAAWLEEEALAKGARRGRMGFGRPLH
jgi:AAA+ superfamily predicted ATPase